MNDIEQAKAILKASGCKPERIKCRQCTIQDVCKTLQIKQWLKVNCEVTQ